MHKQIISIIIVGLIATVNIPDRITAQSITFKGEMELFYYWEKVEIYKDSSIFIQHDFKLNQINKIDSIPAGRYTLTYTSRFKTQRKSILKLRGKSNIKISLPTILTSNRLKTDTSLILKLQETDTLWVGFTQRNCYLPFLHYQEAIIVNQDGHICALITIMPESYQVIVLTAQQIKQLMLIENCQYKKNKDKGCSTMPTFYFYSNRYFKLSTCQNCISLYEVIKSSNE